VTLTPSRSDPGDILDVVVELLEEDGYDGWALRHVAERAHASLATIYKHFPSRDDLIVEAVERWMDRHVYLPIHEPLAGQSVFEALADVFRAIFEPWEDHPQMLEVFVRACATNGRDRLRAQASRAIEPIAQLFEELEPAWAEDLGLILTNTVEGALTRYVNGEILVTDILRDLQRTLYRLEQVVTTKDTRLSRKRTPARRSAARNSRFKSAKRI
jgi:AcrR family transcriptional regulator